LGELAADHGGVRGAQAAYFGTPAVNLVFALNVSLDQIQKEMKWSPAFLCGFLMNYFI
jgi:hypothetical protein